MSDKKYKIDDSNFQLIKNQKDTIAKGREAVGIHQEIIAEITAQNLGMRMQMNQTIIKAMEAAGIPEDERKLKNFRIDLKTQEFIKK